MNKIKAMLAALVLLGSAMVAAVGVSPPAYAGWPGGAVQHAADDSGYNPPIYFRCDNGYQSSLGLGAYSKNYCGDTDAVYVGANARLMCRHNDGRWQLFDAMGWHSLGNWTTILCYQQTDDATNSRVVADVTHAADDSGYNADIQQRPL